MTNYLTVRQATWESADAVYQELKKQVYDVDVVTVFIDAESEESAGLRRFLSENRVWTVTKRTVDPHTVVMSRRPQDKQRLPSYWKQALHLVKDVRQAIEEKAFVVPDEEWNRRIDICLTCPERNFNRCSACGCFINKRAAVSSLECGLVELGMRPFWGKYARPDSDPEQGGAGGPGGLHGADPGPEGPIP